MEVATEMVKMNIKIYLLNEYRQKNMSVTCILNMKNASKNLNKQFLGDKINL